MKSSTRLVTALLALGIVAACGKEQPSTPGAGKNTESRDAAPAASGKVIVVEAYSDADGNYFKPATIEAHTGDIVRFTLKSGVHNVHFLPDSNAGRTGLPPASEMLQLPDQTYDVHVTFAKGRYYFQCDPHAALGMKGHLEVEE
ncbi:MAG: plastocyanin/azurin family copper-binding protein [Gemmatimonadaceae bacterium]